MEWLPDTPEAEAYALGQGMRRPSSAATERDPRLGEAQKCLYAAATLAHAHGKFQTAMKFEEARLGLIEFEVERRG
jgi:hypothetical protein